MRRFELYAEKVLGAVPLKDLAPLLETLSEEELVRLLGGLVSNSHDDRLRRNVVTTALENRVFRLKNLLGEVARPPAERDLGCFTRAIAHALRMEGACIDEVLDADQFRLHGRFGLADTIMDLESCAVSSTAMCAHVVRTRATLHVANIAEDPVWRESPLHKDHGILHYTGAPGFASDGALRCVVWVADKRARSLTEDERELLERLAHHLAIEFATPHLRPTATHAPA